ncbi:MAG: type I methionyl aminopeptidase [Oscillospiraceae bacterium]|jgi:methionyl aminopeptidase|nr:type I methionyl aminopeptidase [Oscillospiraceae bacterium]
MIIIKTPAEIDQMREACIISARALKLGGEAVQPGISTLEIDNIVNEYINSQGAVASFLGYKGFPNCCCISVNDTVVHGIPHKDCILKNGDIVSVDVGAFINGFHGDNAATFPCGDVCVQALKLMDITKESLLKGIEKVAEGNRIGDIANAIQTHVENNGFSVVKNFEGHGIGVNLHEDPSIPNYGVAQRGPRLQKGMVLAIEPMVNFGDEGVRILSDGWTTITSDGNLSAHFEHTVALTEEGCVILTVCE